METLLKRHGYPCLIQGTRRKQAQALKNSKNFEKRLRLVPPKFHSSTRCHGQRKVRPVGSIAIKYKF